MLYQNLISAESLNETSIKTPIELISSTSDIRESMASLPRWSQPFLTWLTGVPLHSQKPSKHGSLYHLFTCLITLGFGFLFCSLGIYIFSNIIAKTALILLGSACSLSAMRKLQVVIAHHCSHSNFFDRKSKWNKRLGNIISFLLFTELFDSYQIAHIHDHHFTEHMTESDPTVKFIFGRLGLKPGMSTKDSSAQILARFFSPDFYFGTWKQRFIEQKQASKKYQLLMTLYAFTLLTTSITLGKFQLLMSAFIFPLFILYPVSSALRLVVEHTFPKNIRNRKFDLGSHSYLTNAVFCGEKLPKGNLSKILWVVRMLMIHLPTRFLILVGDTPVHDHHHRHPLYYNWPNYAYARHAEINNCKDGYSVYREVWGFSNALKLSLNSLQNQRRSS